MCIILLYTLHTPNISRIFSFAKLKFFFIIVVSDVGGYGALTQDQSGDFVQPQQFKVEDTSRGGNNGRSVPRQSDNSGHWRASVIAGPYTRH